MLFIYLSVYSSDTQTSEGLGDLFKKKTTLDNIKTISQPKISLSSSLHSAFVYLPQKLSLDFSKLC